MTNSQILRDLKKERLRTHLDEVENLIRTWSGQLSATEPFSSISSAVWPIQYLPPLEADPDNAHMLRKHVSSRAFWKHHADWIFKLDHVRGLEELLIKHARRLMDILTKESPDLMYTELFLRSALEVAFLLVSGRRSNQEYEHNPERGLRFGASTIEQVAPDTRVAAVEENHRKFIESLEKRTEWEEIDVYWREVKKTEKSMSKMVSDILKSSDIFYPCRFCRKLSQA